MYGHGHKEYHDLTKAEVEFLDILMHEKEEEMFTGESDPETADFRAQVIERCDSIRGKFGILTEQNEPPEEAV